MTSPDVAAIATYLTAPPYHAEVTEALSALFFFAPPDAGQPADHRRPFATLVTSDDHDAASDLNRPGVFRLNIGVGRSTFQQLFAGEQPQAFTALDTLMPHPVYAGAYWVCVLNPSTATFDRLGPLLDEAYQMAKARLARKQTLG